MNMLVFYGAVGGLVVNVLNLLELLNVPRVDWPDFRHPIYWLPFGFWPILGAFLVHLYLAEGLMLRPVLAFHIGLSAPLIVRAMAAASPFGRRPGEAAEDA